MGLQGDLRYCVKQANADGAPGNVIQFAGGLGGTITLKLGPLQITRNLEIDGPGAAVVTVSGNHQSGVFDIPHRPGLTDVRIAGLSVADGTGIPDPVGFVGGGLFNVDATVTLTSVTMTGNVVGGNKAVGRGGAIYNVSGNLVISDSAIVNNRAVGPRSLSFENGGGIDLEGGTLILDHSSVNNNVAAFSAGGIRNLGKVTMTDSTVSGNSARQGGAVFGGELAATRCTFADNVSAASGGAFADVSVATLTDCTIADNSAGSVGGSFEESGLDQVTLVGCSVTGNRSLAAGGAFYWVGGQLKLSNTTVSDNHAAGNGGGIIMKYFSSTPGSLELTSVTLSENHAGAGGGLFIEGPSPVMVLSTILARNHAGAAADAVGAVTSLGNNLVGQADTSSGWVASDLTGTSSNPLDPHLGSLKDNGGPTLTRAPLTNSLAIDHGSLLVVQTYDQRGTFRDFDGKPPDVGAVEARPAVGFRLVAPATVVAGQPFGLTVVAVDAYGNTATGYQGTMKFSSSDRQAQLPANYPMSFHEQGSHTFTATLNTPGTQTVTASDLSGKITGTVTILVESGLSPGTDGLRLLDGLFGAGA
jgi:hypothetical protein